ncbi:DUF2795 domain-containing protein [Corallococcus praedator]|uniref:DUF2795 domain-containing protein n=1 Tax=Corallococcus praedator TaxID=2316724 RepID=A0ABX9QAJ7_9BACT|nr:MULTISPECIES: DUF2795 domain-containing protein [Corallococcus]RKH19994.1 DUF2795 domain-containing protein [Corallococcus sp. CA047B]RKH34505.1 DUF2795 domain-containing protein [Corallococcus sp. CA031C]RKH96858.1 DUF2795 domain-containing protein [Corallococcus praedator]
MTRERLGLGLREVEPSPVPLVPSVSLAHSLQQALQGAVFPLTAEQLTWVARENEAPSHVVSLLGALPRGRFPSVETVAHALEDTAA